MIMIFVSQNYQLTGEIIQHPSTGDDELAVGSVQSISQNMIFMHQDTLLDYSEPCNRAELKTIYLSKFEANKPENKMIFKNRLNGLRVNL